MQKTLTVIDIESGQYPKAKCSDGRRYEGNPGIVDKLTSGTEYTFTLEDKTIAKKDGGSFVKTVIVNVEGLDIPVFDAPAPKKAPSSSKYSDGDRKAMDTNRVWIARQSAGKNAVAMAETYKDMLIASGKAAELGDMKAIQEHLEEYRMQNLYKMLEEITR